MSTMSGVVLVSGGRNIMTPPLPFIIIELKSNIYTSIDIDNRYCRTMIETGTKKPTKYK